MKNLILIFIVAVTFISSSESLAHQEEASFRSWESQKARKTRKYFRYFKKNLREADVFISGDNGLGQMPMIFFRVFQELFPSIWGTFKEKYAPAGLTSVNLDPRTPLPLGMAYTKSQDSESFELNKVGFTCLSCHSGEVRVKPGKVIPLLGAPNTKINNPHFLMIKTMQHENFEAEKIVEAINKKPLGWIYKNRKMLGVERKERAFVNDIENTKKIVDGLKAYAARIMQGYNFYTKFTYSGPYAPEPLMEKRGSMNVLFTTYLTFLSTKPTMDQIKATFPNSAADIDPPSIWNQRGRGFDHWDGSTASKLHRNVGAAASIFNKPVNIKNVNTVSNFLMDLPSPVYPFKVNARKARRGKRLYQKNCLSCHGDQNKVFDYREVGTDEHRFKHLNPKSRGFLGVLLSRLCDDPKYCLKEDQTPYSPSELVRPTIGYASGKLDGIWARAPYLHNGSVPTLRALLTGVRPEKFYRGSISYDQKNVGFEWRKKGKYTVLYDTSLEGNSNRGHDTLEYLGQDWRNQPKKLEDLLEYLKTL